MNDFKNDSFDNGSEQNPLSAPTSQPDNGINEPSLPQEQKEVQHNTYQNPQTAAEENNSFSAAQEPPKHEQDVEASYTGGEGMPYANAGPADAGYVPYHEMHQPPVHENPFDMNNNPNRGWNPVQYTPVAPTGNAQPVSKGLKIFSLILSAVILLSATCLGGYFLGRNNVGKPSLNKKVEVNLAAKPADTDEFTAAQVYDKVNQSIVGIRVYNSSGAMSDASGVLYSKDGYVITNDHIYSEVGAPNFKIYMHDGKEYDATYVAGDAISDLAVLKISGSGFTPAELGDSRQLVSGENVVAVGRPNDATADSSITQGIISAVSRRIRTASNYSARLIQTDSAINPGSSGGALVNMYGQVVGITSSKLAGVEYDAIGFAIPTTTVKRIVEQLIKNGKVTNRAKLGISYTELNSVAAKLGGYSASGLLVASVSEDSDLYNKIKKGDIITHVNGIAITEDDTVLDIIDDAYAGDSITVTVLTSGGAVNEYTAKLKANVGQSSYSAVEKPSSSSSSGSGGSSSDGTFDFPYGE